MRESLDTFVARYKEVTESHMSVYDGTESKLAKWNADDFDVSGIMDSLDTTGHAILFSLVKRAYDIVRAYHRAYKIYLQGREDYYRYAIMDRKKDILAIDAIVNSIGNAYDALQQQVEIDE